MNSCKSQTQATASLCPAVDIAESDDKSKRLACRQNNTYSPPSLTAAPPSSPTLPITSSTGCQVTTPPPHPSSPGSHAPHLGSPAMYPNNYFIPVATHLYNNKHSEVSKNTRVSQLRLAGQFEVFIHA